MLSSPHHLSEVGRSLLASYFFKALINSDGALSWLPLARKYPVSPPGCFGQFLCWGHPRPWIESFLSLVASFSNLQPAAEEGNRLITTRAVTMRWRKKLQAAGGCAGRVMIFTFLSFIPQVLDAHRPLFSLPPQSEAQQCQFEVYPKVIMWLFFLCRNYRGKKAKNKTLRIFYLCKEKVVKICR